MTRSERIRESRILDVWRKVPVDYLAKGGWPFEPFEHTKLVLSIVELLTS